MFRDDMNLVVGRSITATAFAPSYELGDRYPGYVAAEYHPTELSFRDREKVRWLASFDPQDIE